MNAFDIPINPHPKWFALRDRIVAAMIDVEMERGTTLEGLIATVAPKVGVEINTLKEYHYVEPIFEHCRGIARSRIKRIRDEHGGQWLLFPTGLREAQPQPRKPKPERQYGRVVRTQLPLELTEPGPDEPAPHQLNDDSNLLNIL